MLYNTKPKKITVFKINLIMYYDKLSTKKGNDKNILNKNFYTAIIITVNMLK